MYNAQITMHNVQKTMHNTQKTMYSTRKNAQNTEQLYYIKDYLNNVVFTTTGRIMAIRRRNIWAQNIKSCNTSGININN